MRARDPFADQPEVALGESYYIECDKTLIAIENADLDFLSVVGRKCRDTKIDRATVDRGRKAAVLRLAPFVEPGGCKHFHPRDQGAGGGGRGDYTRMQIARD